MADYFLIDPADKRITAVEHPATIRGICNMLDCERFDAARFNRYGDAVFVDDEGLIKGPRNDFFLIHGYENPLPGRGLVVGCDEYGNTTPPHVDLDWLQDHIRWVEPVKFGDQIAWITR